MKDKSITGIILAGGKSMRMGEEKGLVKFRGKPMIEYSIALFEKLNYAIIIIANSPCYDNYGYPVYTDIVADKGPMSGIYTALHHSHTQWNAVITCDVPLIDFRVYERMENNRQGHEAVMPRFNNRLQPLTSMYTANCKASFYNSIQNDQLKVRNLTEKISTKIIDFDVKFKSSFTNINTKEELEQCK